MSREIKLLFAPEDRELFAPVLEELRSRGLSVSEDTEFAKNDVILAALSERFYTDGEAVKKLLDCLAAGAENVLPLQLDTSPIPDQVKNALYARNIIPASGRDSAQIAERIVSALPKKNRRLPVLLSAAALVLAVAAGLLIWNGSRKTVEETEPVMAEPESPVVAYGMTEEELRKIQVVIIVGEQAEFYSDERIDGPLPDMDTFASRDYYDGGPHWFSKEDGHEYTLTSYDLSFVELMPNLRSLILAEVEAEQLPELSKLHMLNYLFVFDSVIPDLDWVAGSNINRIEFCNSTGSVHDFSPLSTCQRLRNVHIDLSNCRQADLSGFAPERLNRLWINSADEVQELDLSGLRNCKELTICELEGVRSAADLDFLSGAEKLAELRLNNMERLRDISALGGLTNLKTLSFESCGVTDFEPLANCSALESFYFGSWDRTAVPTAALAGMSHLRELRLSNVYLSDLDFLREIAEHRYVISLELDGEVGDFSGLEAFRIYEDLTFDFDYATPLEEIMSHLPEDVSISNLRLQRFGNVDLSLLGGVSQSVELNRCLIADLSSMPEDWSALHLILDDCPNLRSLEGLQNQSRIGAGAGQLEIINCPRLYDWTALQGMKLTTLQIIGGYTLPDFTDLVFTGLRVDSVGDVDSLDFLEGLDTGLPYNLAFVGMDGITSLEPLRAYHGTRLTVSPQLAEQAEDLVKAGNFREYAVEYPRGGWDDNMNVFVLQSLEELETMPEAMLRHVSSVCIVGDRVIDATDANLWVEYENDRPRFMMHRWDRDYETVIECGQGVVKDLSMFSALTGLRELCLYGQPLEDLSGIQAFSELERFEAVCCPALTDASALFTLQELRNVSLNGTGIDSIQGVQNLPKLCSLGISDTRVDDLTPLAQGDFSFACQDGGFQLDANELDLDEEDFRAIGTIRILSNLAFTDADPAVWIPALAGCEIYRFGAAGDLQTNEDLAAFAADHPELESIWLGWMDQITDLTPLLNLENLRSVEINRNMAAAIASLQGQEYSFELRLN